MTKHSDAPAASTTRIHQVLVASFTSTTTSNNNIALRLFKRDDTSGISIIGFGALKPRSEVRSGASTTAANSTWVGGHHHESDHV